MRVDLIRVLDRPESIERGLERGRASARAVAERSLAGLPERGPRPPAFDGPDPDWRLDGAGERRGAQGTAADPH